MKRLILACAYVVLSLCAALAGTAHAYPATTNGHWHMAQPMHGGMNWTGDYSAVGACQKMEAEATRVYGAQTTYQFQSVTGTASGTPGPVGGPGTMSNLLCNIQLTQKSNGAVSTSSMAMYWQATAPYCPAGGTLTNGQCVCAAGEIDTGSACQQNQCAANAGQTSIINITNGWARSNNPDALDHVGSLYSPWDQPGGSTVCDGSCQAEITETQDCYRSGLPAANGLYRMSCDYVAIKRNATCTTSANSPESKNAAPPPCPGELGTVNGVPKCLGTSAKPVPAATGKPLPAPEKSGNPAAGEKPSSGEGAGTGGSGRTPSTGDGSAKGGPAGSVIIIGGGGTQPKPADGTEQKNCGAAGQEKCAVKVDESGTPSTVDTAPGLGQLKAAADQRDGLLDSIKGKGDKDTSFAMPSWLTPGSCSPWDLGTLPVIEFKIELDLCEIHTLLLGVLSFLWVLATWYGCLGLVKSTVAGGRA